MKVVSLKDHPYGVTHHPAGEVYEMEDANHVRIMTTLGLVKVAPDRVQSKDVQVEEPRKYRRRDMKSDE